MGGWNTKIHGFGASHISLPPALAVHWCETRFHAHQARRAAFHAPPPPLGDVAWAIYDQVACRNASGQWLFARRAGGRKGFSPIHGHWRQTGARVKTWCGLRWCVEMSAAQSWSLHFLALKVRQELVRGAWDSLTSHESNNANWWREVAMRVLESILCVAMF